MINGDARYLEAADLIDKQIVRGFICRTPFYKAYIFVNSAIPSSLDNCTWKLLGSNVSSRVR